MARSAAAPARPNGPRERRREYPNRVLDRAVAILGAFGPSRPELRLAEFTGVGLHKSTLFRLLESLRSHRLVELDPETGRYRLGLRLFQLGMLAVERLEVGRSSEAALADLVDRTGETAHVGVLDAGEIVSIARAEGRHALRLPGSIGRRSPAYCTGMGKVLLAHLPAEAVRDYLARTPLKAFTRRTLTNPSELQADLRAAKQRGYAIDDEEIHPGIRCIAAPIRDHTGGVVAAVSAAGPTTRLPREQMPKVAAEVMRAAAEISRRLGHTSEAS